MKLQSAVKKETVAVGIGTGIGCLALIAVFLIFYLIFPESSVKFDYRVVLGALVGGAVAVANFFLMAVTVQNVVNVTNRDDALRIMRVSYRNRMLMRAIWIIVAIFAPCFNYAAGIIPLFIPSIVIKIRGIKLGVTGKNAAPPSGTAPEEGEAVPEDNEAALQEKEAALQKNGAVSQEKEAALQKNGAASQEKEAALQKNGAASQEKEAAPADPETGDAAKPAEEAAE